MVRDVAADDQQHVPERAVSDHEAQVLLGVRQRLLDRFPSLGSAVVHQVVQDAYVSMTGPIRDFVPLLVEHSARDHLAELSLSDAHPG